MADLSTVQGRALWLLSTHWTPLPLDGVTRPTAQVLVSKGFVEVADRRRRVVRAARDASCIRLTRAGVLARRRADRPRKS
jgi:uncharacterized NAD(P)/FAD-binding protein YdhS